MSVSGQSIAQHIIEHEILGLGTTTPGGIVASPASNIWLISSNNSPGNLTLSGVTWANRYTYITSINAKTASTNWNLYICETSSFDLTHITTRQIVSSGNQNMLINVNFSVNSDSNNLYIVYEDNSGSNLLSLYIAGEIRQRY